MTLDEAIKHCKEVAKQQEVKANELYKAKDFEESRDCIWCSKEHEQLAEWLKELKKFREQQPYEKFESTKDHIYKLAGDYKCWDNRLTEDEAVELCHILEQEPCEEKIIEWKKDFKEYVNSLSMLNDDYKGIMEYIDELPVASVQPEYNTSEWCHGCKEYNNEKHCCPRFNRVIRNTVEEMKKPKVGHWIFDEILDRNYYCSECKSMGVDYWDYCPYCGARMVEPQESE